jgi:hypothetical protein
MALYGTSIRSRRRAGATYYRTLELGPDRGLPCAFFPGTGITRHRPPRHVYIGQL